MKKFSLIFVFILVIGLTGCVSDYPTEIQVYDFDTAVVQYDLSGQAPGNMTLYIRGDQMAIFRSEGGLNTAELILGEEKYIINVDRATALKASNPSYAKLKGMSKEEQEKFLVKRALGLRENAEDPEIFSSKVVAGQNCNVYIIPNIGSACIWNGVLLEKEISILDVASTQTAVSVQTNVEIPSERFELPANVIVQ